MSGAGDTPQATSTKRSRKRTVLLCASAVALAGLGWFVVVFALPFIQARSAVRGCFDGSVSRETAVDKLGGAEAAAKKLILYYPHAWNAQNRIQALNILGCCGSAGAPALAGELSSPDVAVRRAAADGLARIGEGAACAAVHLEKALADSDQAVRLSAVQALGAIGPSAASATGALTAIAAAPSSAPDLRLAAIEALGHIGQAAASALSELRNLMRDRSAEMRIASAVAICRMGAGDREVIKPLTTALTDKDWEVRLEAARTLGRLGALARPALPELERARGNDNISDVREAAAAALTKINGR